MKFILDEAGGGHAIQHYDRGEFTVSGVVYRENLLVMPDQVVPRWHDAGFAELASGDFQRLAGFAPEIIILGTGANQHFPAPALTLPLMEARIGLEVMDTAAACRTYNILMSEGRRVAAALLTIEP
ncbi:MAG: Mth938-like domain-containing protein [Candidatus Thiodiazotropha sp.]